MTVRPRVSARLTSSAPSRAATGSTRACRPPTSARAACGATSPTKPDDADGRDRGRGEQRRADQRDEPGALQPDAEHPRGVVVEREQVEVAAGRTSTGVSTTSATATGTPAPAVRP